MKNKTLIVISLVIVSVHILFPFFYYTQALKRIQEETQAWANVLEANFHICLDSKATAMQKLATFIASDPKIQKQFKICKTTWLSENKGKGGPKTAVEREKLYNLLSPSWAKVVKSYDVRQLHFHMPPGATSFLRVHKPFEFGDRLDDVRHIIVAVNESHKPFKGFETGRHYTGIRGAVPVVAEHGSKNPEHLGALEAGTSYSKFLNSMKAKMNSDFCILLYKDHVDKNMNTKSISTHFAAEQTFKDFYIEESTTPNAIELLNSSQIYSLVLEKKAAFIKEKTPFQIAAFPIRDFYSKNLPNHNDSGLVFIFKDAGKKWNTLKKNLNTVILLSLIAACFLGLILVLVWNYSRKKLNTIIKEQAAEMRGNYEKLDLFIKASPTAIFTIDPSDKTIISANPMAIKMLDMKKESLIGKRRIDDILKRKTDEKAVEEFIVTSAQGQDIPVLKVEIPLIINKKEMKILSLRDISKEKRLEIEKIKKEKLQGIIEMAGAVSHELNQPMQVITTALELLSDHNATQDEKVHLSNELLHAIEKMKTITGKLMNITSYKTKAYLSGKIVDIEAATQENQEDEKAPDKE
ncbi:MAG: PAS domain-containing protein [Desulfobacterales bacterium]|nr:PAS domain-containing protein [Desulfobacterales bacterium]